MKKYVINKSYIHKIETISILKKHWHYYFYLFLFLISKNRCLIQKIIKTINCVVKLKSNLKLNKII